MGDPLLQSAILWRIQTLAESATTLSPELQVRHPEIPWREIRGFRNIVVHAYVDRLDPELVWTYVVENVDALGEMASAELAELRDD
jgi:uncharacterized protein with HEPN domain